MWDVLAAQQDGPAGARLILACALRLENAVSIKHQGSATGSRHTMVKSVTAYTAADMLKCQVLAVAAAEAADPVLCLLILKVC